MKFFSPDLIKTSQLAKMTLENMYTVSQPKKYTIICINFQIAASFLPVAACLGKRL